MSDFLKFPSTPHLLWLEASPPRDDKVLSLDAVEEFLATPLVIEEKVDGANVGFSFSSDGELRIQNRGQFLSSESGGQFKGIWQWARQREDRMFDALSDNLILFGEWCYARHTIRYDRLPDWFLGFDVYDRFHGEFWSTQRRNELLGSIRLSPVAEIAGGRFNRARLTALLGTQSLYAATRIEGLYLRREDGRILLGRAKIVNAAFVSGIENHWSKAPLVVNECRVTYG
jgi:hypothetical protein